MDRTTVPQRKGRNEKELEIFHIQGTWARSLDSYIRLLSVNVLLLTGSVRRDYWTHWNTLRDAAILGASALCIPIHVGSFLVDLLGQHSGIEQIYKYVQIPPSVMDESVLECISVNCAVHNDKISCCDSMPFTHVWTCLVRIRHLSIHPYPQSPLS